jgi:hypothetical protein
MELGVPELLLAVITVLTPILAAIANQSKWSSKTKNAVALGISAVLALSYTFFTDGFSVPAALPATILAVYGLQQLVYKQFLEKLSKEIEAATDVKPGQTIVVEEDKENVVVETGGENAEVHIQTEETDATPVAPNYQAQHRGDVPLG